MDKPFLVIKQHLNDYTHKAFETAEQAQEAINPSEDFPGEYVTVYDLKTNRFIHQEQFPGIYVDHLLQIVKLYK